MQLPKLWLEKEGTFDKEALSRLGNDPKQWEKEIMEMLHEEHPYIPDHNMEIKIHKQEPDQGVMVGNIMIDKKIKVPLIVEDFKLHPLDVMQYDDRIMPMSQESVQAILQGTKIGDPSVRTGAGANVDISAAGRPPHTGKYAVASIVGSVTEDQFETVIDRAFSSAGLTYDLQTCPAFRDGLKHYSGIIKEAAQAPEPEKQELELLELEQYKEASVGGVYEIRTDRGTETGVLFDKLASFEGELTDQLTFVSADKTAFASGGRMGVRSPKSGSWQEDTDLEGKGILYVIKEGQMVCTAPFAITHSGKDFTSIETEAGFKYDLFKSASYSGLSRVGSDIFAHSDWKFTKVGESVSVSEAEVANQIELPAESITLRQRGDQYTVYSSLPGLRELSGTGVPLSTIKTAFSAYATETSLDKALQQLDETNDLHIKEIHPITGKVVKNKNLELGKEAKAALLKAATYLTPEICKVADINETEAKDTVDSTLGLNFLSSAAMMEMMDYIDPLETARESVTKLLLASRMGLSLDSKVLRTSAFALDAVVKELKQLRHTEQNSVSGVK